jgi:phospholipid/cholesterol/gamma-HCH transport system ATP-binding protein
MAETVIRIRGLRNQFGEQVVHDGLDLDVMRGEVMGLVGGSGSGKSVLMNTILGLNRPRAGAYLGDGAGCAHRDPDPLWSPVPERRAVFVADRGRERAGSDA